MEIVLERIYNIMKKTSQKIIVRLIVQKQTAPLWMFGDLKSCMLKQKNSDDLFSLEHPIAIKSKSRK